MKTTTVLLIALLLAVVTAQYPENGNNNDATVAAYRNCRKSRSYPGLYYKRFGRTLKYYKRRNCTRYCNTTCKRNYRKKKCTCKKKRGCRRSVAYPGLYYRGSRYYRLKYCRGYCNSKCKRRYRRKRRTCRKSTAYPGLYYRGSRYYKRRGCRGYCNSTCKRNNNRKRRPCRKSRAYPGLYYRGSKYYKRRGCRGYCNSTCKRNNNRRRRGCRRSVAYPGLYYRGSKYYRRKYCRGYCNSSCKRRYRRKKKTCRRSVSYPGLYYRGSRYYRRSNCTRYCNSRCKRNYSRRVRPCRKSRAYPGLYYRGSKYYRYRNCRGYCNSRCKKNRRRCRVPTWARKIRFPSAAQAKAYALRVCNHRNRFIKYSCIYDRSVGIFHNRREYNRLASYHFAGKRCISAGDPHVRTLSGRRFNIYNVHNRWTVLMQARRIYAKTFLTYSRKWGRRSLNRNVYIRIAGKTYTAGRHGRSNFRWNSANSRRKSKTIKRAGYTVKLDWNRSPQGGYYNINIWGGARTIGNCRRGSCCYRYRGQKAYRGKSKLRRFRSIRSIRFRSKCLRKRVAIAKCRKLYSRVHYRRRFAYVKRCVAARGRAGLGIRRFKGKCRVPNWAKRIRFPSTRQAKAYAIRACRYRNRFIKYSCVYDRSVGIEHNRRVYNQLAHYHFAGQTCVSAGDPHIRTFSGKKYNLYHVHNSWVNLLQSKRFKGKAFLTFSRKWGRRSLNRALEFDIAGKIYKFKRRGGVSGIRWRVNRRRYKTVIIRRAGYTVSVYWRTSPQGGYYSVRINASKATVGRCVRGSCCNSYRHTGRGRATLKRGSIRRIRFRSRCYRKKIAIRKCSAYVRRYRRRGRNFVIRLLKGCVSRRRR